MEGATEISQAPPFPSPQGLAPIQCIKECTILRIKRFLFNTRKGRVPSVWGRKDWRAGPRAKGFSHAQGRARVQLTGSTWRLRPSGPGAYELPRAYRVPGLRDSRASPQPLSPGASSCQSQVPLPSWAWPFTLGRPPHPSLAGNCVQRGRRLGAGPAASRAPSWVDAGKSQGGKRSSLSPPALPDPGPHGDLEVTSPPTLPLRPSWTACDGCFLAVFFFFFS